MKKGIANITAGALAIASMATMMANAAWEWREDVQVNGRTDVSQLTEGEKELLNAHLASQKPSKVKVTMNTVFGDFNCDGTYNDTDIKVFTEFETAIKNSRNHRSVPTTVLNQITGKSINTAISNMDTTNRGNGLFKGSSENPMNEKVYTKDSIEYWKKIYEDSDYLYGYETDNKNDNGITFKTYSNQYYDKISGTYDNTTKTEKIEIDPSKFKNKTIPTGNIPDVLSEQHLFTTSYSGNHYPYFEIVGGVFYKSGIIPTKYGERRDGRLDDMYIDFDSVGKRAYGDNYTNESPKPDEQGYTHQGFKGDEGIGAYLLSFADLDNLLTIEIPEDIERVEDGAFKDCDRLDDVTFWGKDTEIEDNAFEDVPNLHVHGYVGSTAEQFADDHGYDFIPLDPWDYYMLGDVNNDKTVDSSDASLVLSEYALTATGQGETFIYLQKKAGDVNFDKAIDSTDASNILGYYAFKSTGGASDFPTYLSDNKRIDYVNQEDFDTYVKYLRLAEESQKG